MLSILRRIQYRLSSFTNNQAFRDIQTEEEYEWIGNQGAGFFVATQHIPQNANVYSLGVGLDISFDLHLMRFFNANIFAYDPTPKTISWIDEQDLPEHFHFKPFAIGKKAGFTYFYPPKNEKDVSCTIAENPEASGEKIKVPVKSLRDIVNENQTEALHILKIDIEGSEYELINDILEISPRVHQLLIEFHHSNLYVPDMNRRSSSFIKKLNRVGFKCFAINNSREFSFINTQFND